MVIPASCIVSEVAAGVWSFFQQLLGKMCTVLMATTMSICTNLIVKKHKMCQVFLETQLLSACITSTSVYYNSLTSTGAIALAGALQQNKSLEELK